MRAATRFSALLVSALLAVGLLALASPVIAGTNPTVRGTDLLFPQGFDKFYDKIHYEAEAAVPPAVQAAGATAKSFSRLAVRLYGGWSYLMAGDINDGSDYYFELVELYVAAGFGTSTGGYSPLHGGYNFGGDIIFQLSPNIGVGIGAGYLRSSKNSLMTLTEEEDTVTLTAAPTISAVPIRLGVFLTFPVTKKINLTADVGGAYYAGLKFDAWQRVAFATEEWYQNSLSASKSGNLGFQGSLGFEYMFSPKMGFFVEAVGRYAKFNNFASATGTNTDSTGGTPETTTGKIYIVTYTDTEGTYSGFTIEDTTPVDNPPYVTYREPKFDLSGFSVQAGIKIRF
jgi:hypothetical protein